MGGQYGPEYAISKGYINEHTEIIPENNRNITKCSLSLTSKGEMAYHELKKRKRNEWIQAKAFWLLFIAAIVSAIYAGFTYHDI